MPDLYDVVITLEAPEGAEKIAGLLVDVFSGSDRATVARPAAVSTTDSEVIVRFSEVAAEVPPPGADYRPPREDEPSERPGRIVLEGVADMPADALLPTLRALVALSAARERAGLSPRQSITLHVEPAKVHALEELRHS